MEQLDTDTLALMAPSAVARLKLGCVSRRLRNALRALNAARRTRVYSAVTWFGRNMVLELVINAPVVVRIVWHTTKRMKEMRLLLPTASQTGQVLDGECNFVLYNIDVVFLEYTPNGVPRSEKLRPALASLYMRHRACRPVIFAPIGGRLANGRVEMRLGFVTPRRTFDQVLSLLVKTLVAEYSAPAPLD